MFIGHFEFDKMTVVCFIGTIETMKSKDKSMVCINTISVWSINISLLIFHSVSMYKIQMNLINPVFNI